jgi:predicted DsbA family dithiol-disulfide isomerase
MQIEVWSDLVCPWCYIGFVRLNKAIAEVGVPGIEVKHHAYQLDRVAGFEPKRAVEFLAQAYGIDIEDAMALNEDVSDVAAGEGLQYKLSDNLIANTLLGHRLLVHAEQYVKSHELLMRLFHHNFELAEPIFSLTDLEPHAIAVGLDWPTAVAALESDAYIDEIRESRNRAELVGVRGTPYFLIDGKAAINGADSVATLVTAIRSVI